MKYYSTRDTSVRMESAEAVKMGLSRDGGLLTPVEIPRIDRAFLEGLLHARYQERAAKVMGLYLTDYTEEELLAFAENAYGPDKFDTPAVAAVGTMLNIKPVMQIRGGKLDMFRKVRGMKQAQQVMLDAVRQDLEQDFAGRRVIVATAYSGDPEQGALWAETVRGAFPGHPFMTDPLPLSIGCHVGPGALGAGLVLDYDEI